jgi:hypothetical protein
MTSTIKVNNIQNQCGQNIINENSNTITIGASGDTIALASGASQTGFGREGSVNWQTSIKTTTFTAVSGEGYFVDTSSGAVTVNLPAGSVGAIVAIKDYAGTFQTNNLTVAPNGTDKIDSVAGDATISTENASITLVFADSTRGWLNVNDSTNVVGSQFISATGGTITTVCTNFKAHIFTGPGTFQVTAGAGPLATVDYFVVAGGGSATGDRGGGGGAGGFRVSNSIGCIPAPTMSPLSNPTGLPVSVQSYSITVGGGGAAASPPTGAGGNGNPSTFSTITSTGGGGSAVSSSGNTGGSGSGGYCNPGSLGNTPPVSPPQGNPGGNGASSNQHGAGGGGGAAAAGADGTTPGVGGAGGAGSFLADAVIGPTAPSYGEGGPVSNTRYFAGGGGGSFYGDPGPGTPGAGGVGGGGDGANCSPGNGGNGVANTGGGGGGGIQKSGPGTGGTGGSGIVVIRYKFQ